jgi:hypothetical protein
LRGFLFAPKPSAGSRQTDFSSSAGRETAGSSDVAPLQASSWRLRRYASRRERPTPLPDEAPELIESNCAPVYFVNGIVLIQNLRGGNFLITFYRTDDRYREGEVKVAVARCDLEVMLRAADGAVQGVPVTEPECLTPMWRMRAAGSSI